MGQRKMGVSEGIKVDHAGLEGGVTVEGLPKGSLRKEWGAE